MTDLIDHLADTFDAPEDDEAREHWRIENDAVATWALRKLWALDKERQRLADQAAAEIERIKQWLEQVTGTLEHDRRFFDGALTGYHRQLMDEGRAEQTYKLPAGTLSARKTPASVEVTDPDAFRDWAEGNGHLELLRIKIEPDKRALAAALKETGEIPPGVILHQGGELTFSAKPADIDLAPPR